MRRHWKTVSVGFASFVVVFLVVAICLLLAGAASAGSSEDPRLTEARTLLEAGRYSEGLAVLEQILTEQPDHRDALFLKALAYEWQGQIDEALKIYRTIVSVHEEDLNTWLQVAKLEARRENFDEAISLYGTLISRFGEEPPILIGLARTLSLTNRLDEALKYYDRVLLQEPDDVEALAGKAQVLRLTGEPREARKVIQQAQHLEPTFAGVQEESREIDQDLAPRVLASYCESLEENYLRSKDTDYLNLEKRTWRSTVTFFPDVVEDLSFDLWTSRDWEIDKILDRHNFDLTSMGLAANFGIRLWEPVKLEGNLKVVQYQNHLNSAGFPLLHDEERDENFDVWLSVRHETWGVNLGVGTYPFFEKTSTPPLPDKVEIGEQTVTRFGVTKIFSKSTQCSLGYEGGDYNDGNDRNKVHGSVQVSPPGAPWLSLVYGTYYQDYKKTSRNYLVLLDELNQRLEVSVKKLSQKTSIGAGFRLGVSNSENFNSISSACLYGSLSRTLTNRLRLEGKGFLSYDDKDYSMRAFYFGLELKL